MNNLLDTASAARFHSRYRASGVDQCWPWTGKLDNGYGRFWLAGRSRLAHQIAWELANDRPASSPGLNVDHLCRTRACVNPAHLELVTIGENVLRGVGITATNAAKVECVNGHPFDDENTYRRRNGARACITCAVERTRAWRADRKCA